MKYRVEMHRISAAIIFFIGIWAAIFFIVGVTWEVYEFLKYGETFPSKDDTVIGVWLAFYLAIFKFSRIVRVVDEGGENE